MKQFGRYEVLEEIGSGAMGAVFKARDPVMDRVVAVKTVHASALVGPLAEQYRERFTRESRAAARLAHAGIVTVFDAGVEGDTPYLVMEFVPGRTLEAVLNSGERYAPESISEIGQQIAEALGYAHSNGVVHRDIKPANIQLTGKPERAKIMDFGVAKLTQAQVTSTGTLLGTPAFMAPEQFTGMPLDGRSDLFSLGVILYWMATGDKPFSGDTITAVSYKIVHTEPIAPRQLNPGIPAALEAIILRALSKDPATRYQTGEQMAADLAALRGTSNTASGIRLPAPAPAGSATISAAVTIPLASGAEARRSAIGGATAAPSTASAAGQSGAQSHQAGRSGATLPSPSRLPAPEIPRRVTTAPPRKAGARTWIYIFTPLLVLGLLVAGIASKKKHEEASRLAASQANPAAAPAPVIQTPAAPPATPPVVSPTVDPGTASVPASPSPALTKHPGESAAAEGTPAASRKPPAAEAQPDLSAYALRLEVSASAASNVEITADDNAPQTRSLRAGDSFRLGADKIFQVRTDNGGGIHLKLNDKDMPDLGPLGSPRTARLTARNLPASGPQPGGTEAAASGKTGGGKNSAAQAQLDVEVSRLPNFADLTVWVDGTLLVERPGEMKGGGGYFSKMASIAPGTHTIAVFIGREGKGKRQEISGDFSGGQSRTLRVSGHFQGRREAGMFGFDLALE